MRARRKCHLAADRVTVADLEACDRLARQCAHGFLAADLLHVANGAVQHFLVGHGLAHAHVQRDLGNARYPHRVFHAQLLLDLPVQFFAVLFL